MTWLKKDGEGKLISMRKGQQLEAEAVNVKGAFVSPWCSVMTPECKPSILNRGQLTMAHTHTHRDDEPQAHLSAILPNLISQIILSHFQTHSANPIKFRYIHT